MCFPNNLLRFTKRAFMVINILKCNFCKPRSSTPSRNTHARNKALLALWSELQCMLVAEFSALVSLRQRINGIQMSKYWSICLECISCTGMATGRMNREWMDVALRLASSRELSKRRMMCLKLDDEWLI